jgi:hypothetical protein
MIGSAPWPRVQIDVRPERTTPHPRADMEQQVCLAIAIPAATGKVRRLVSEDLLDGRPPHQIEAYRHP